MPTGSGPAAPPAAEGRLPSGTTTRGAARTLLAARLRTVGLACADLDARLLVCAACGIDHLALIRDPDLILGASAAAVLADYARRRLSREPVSRILGTREFWGLSFAIGPGVLDPRPDTEALVGAVLDAFAARCHERVSILDLGTGSGAVLAALLHEMPCAFGIGIDLSPDACRIAATNLRTLGLAERSAMVNGRWGAAVRGCFDVIVSNPPYIATSEIDDLEGDVRDFDPRTALDGGCDGLQCYRAILNDCAGCLARGGIAAVECGCSQARAVAALFNEAGLRDVAIIRDLSGRDRVVLATA